MISKIAKRIAKTFIYLLIITVLAITFRVFLFDFYRIPSWSMEPTIIPGDYIMVEKCTYGARLFKTLRSEAGEDPPIVRVPSFGSVERNDVVVFNFPRRHSRDSIRMNMDTLYVKRCIGLPGDSLSFNRWRFHVAGYNGVVGYLPAQRQLALENRTADSCIRTFPYDSCIGWNALNFGPLFIPAKGSTIALNARNYAIYRQMITYETDGKVELCDTTVAINDTVCNSYTFRNNWYFMTGDNIDNSMDSRYIGLVPESYIVGRACRILWSKDIRSGKWRWERILKKIR